MKTTMGTYRRVVIVRNNIPPSSRSVCRFISFRENIQIQMHPRAAMSDEATRLLNRKIKNKLKKIKNVRVIVTSGTIVSHSELIWAS